MFFLFFNLLAMSFNYVCRFHLVYQRALYPLHEYLGVDGIGRRDQPGFSYKGCSEGLRLHPRKGDALLFWSLDNAGEYDDHSLHGGCEVVRGTKWVATKWLRTKAGF